MIRLVDLLAFILLLLFCPACGVRQPAEESDPAVATVELGSARSDDPAIAALQDFIHAAEQKGPYEMGSIKRGMARWRYKLPKPPRVNFEKGKNYFWHLETNKGKIKLRFLTTAAPMHVSNALYLTLLGFYDGLKFHRSMKGFMVQGGCPAGNGRGDPGYRLNLEVSRDARHDRPGMLAAANSGRPNTDGSQFYILFAPAPHLDNGYSVYGELAEDMKKESLATLKAMEALSGRGDGPPSTPLVLKKASLSVE